MTTFGATPTSRLALAALPEITHTSEHDWQAREAEHHRWRGSFALATEDIDAARAFGCLLELPGGNERIHAYVTDAEWLADLLGERIATHATAEARRHRDSGASPSTPADDEREARRQERQRQYEERAPARARNLDLGAALALGSRGSTPSSCWARSRCWSTAGQQRGPFRSLPSKNSAGS